MTKTVKNVNENIAFDFAAQNEEIVSLEKMRADNKLSRAAMTREESAKELRVVYRAMSYASATNDLQPLAQAVKRVKLSPIAKRAIAKVFFQYEYALIGDAKRPAFVFNGDGAKLHDAIALQVLSDAYESGDGFTCDQVKIAFPAPKVTASQAVSKLTSAIAKRMKEDGVTKAELIAAINAMA
jgi:hypothetical protein